MIMMYTKKKKKKKKNQPTNPIVLVSVSSMKILQTESLVQVAKMNL